MICSEDTNNIGLCVSNLDDCNIDYKLYDKSKYEIPEIIWTDTQEDQEEKEIYDKAEQKGYVSGNLINSCYIQSKEPVIYNYNDGENVKEIFSIITLNVMSIYRNGKDDEAVLDIMRLRAQMLIDFIIKYKPDILCFQEMSAYFFKFLYEDNEIIRNIYPYYYEDRFSHQLLEDRNKHSRIETVVLSKYKANKVRLYELEGNLNYTNSMLVVEYNNLVVFNCYCQAGSISSNGQKYKWKHYSRCRKQQYSFIKSLVDEYNNQKAVVILGDFNADLNNPELFPEIKLLNSFGFNDSWIQANNHRNPIEGSTENTDINTLRYNNKFQNKHYRYDAILYNDKLDTISSFVFGDESKILTNKNDNRLYELVFISDINDPRLKIICKDNENKNIYDLFISDHFGVLSQFKFVS